MIAIIIIVAAILDQVCLKVCFIHPPSRISLVVILLSRNADWDVWLVIIFCHHVWFHGLLYLTRNLIHLVKFTWLLLKKRWLSGLEISFWRTLVLWINMWITLFFGNSMSAQLNACLLLWIIVGAPISVIVILNMVIVHIVIVVPLPTNDVVGLIMISFTVLSFSFTYHIDGILIDTIV